VCKKQVFLARGLAPQAVRLAAWVAAAAAICISTERIFEFRDKWRLHLAVLGKLETLKMECEGRLDQDAAMARLTDILDMYHQSIPIAPVGAWPQ